MDKIEQIKRLLSASSDPDNPPADTVAQLLTDVQHIAVVGLSRDLEKPARRIPSYLAAKGYDVIPVNPSAERLLGRRSHSKLRDVPSPVDLVLIFRPGPEADGVVAAAAERADQPSIWLQTGIRSPEAVARARALGRTVIQDLCVFRVHRALLD